MSTTADLQSPSKLQRIRHRIPAVCVALSGAAMVERASALAPTHSFFEFRLDTLPDPSHVLPQLSAFLQSSPQMLAIATCRRQQNGGHFSGSPQAEIHLLAQAVNAGVQITDLSLETAEEMGNPEALEELRNSSAALLLSWHDFHQTPDLESVYRRMLPFSPEIFKIVPTAKSLRDSLVLLDFLKAHKPEGNIVAMAMGQPGVPSRVLGPCSGSLFTFAAADAGSETAPGQVSAETLRDLYRIDRITSQTGIYGVFGKPIAGSKSPVMLNTAFRETGRDAVYLPLETNDPAELLDAVKRLPLEGASVTMPLKEQVVELLPELDPMAKSLGAANTLVRHTSGSVTGFNTDAAGILDPLSQRISLGGAKILVLGAGGAARAAVIALRGSGAEVFILNRTAEKAKKLASESGATVLDRNSLSHHRFDAVLNATPYGMANQQIEAPIDFDAVQCGLFFDMVYNPLETPLIAAARAKGIAIIPGIEMFLAQGMRQFHLWTGQPAPAESMREAVLASLREDQASRRG